MMISLLLFDSLHAGVFDHAGPALVSAATKSCISPDANGAQEQARHRRFL
jgi:hypothetical protein